MAGGPRPAIAHAEDTLNLAGQIVGATDFDGLQARTSPRAPAPAAAAEQSAYTTNPACSASL
jgi:hypothetical protein